MSSFVKKYVPYGTWVMENLDFLVLLGIVVLIPFSIRYVFDTNLNFQTGAYSDFTSLSLYLSDFLTIFLIIRLFSYLKGSIWNQVFGATLFWIALELTLHRFPPLQSYFSVRLVSLFTLAAVIRYLPLSKGKIVATTWTFAVLGAIQSIISTIQFIIQKSLGLYFLGESQLSPHLYGVAKIVAHGTKLIRGYGTFPHSNLFAAFLVTSSILCLYLLTLNYQKRTKIIISALFSLNFVGIFLSFSRGGLLAVLMGIGLLIISMFLVKKRDVAIAALVLTIIIGSISALALRPYLLTRSTISDQAVKERLFYNKVGWSIIKDRPIIGTGPGMSVLHMERYSPTKLESWEIQPIHNYYLIMFAEWGIGGVLLLTLILIPIVNLIKKARTSLKQQASSSFLWETALISIMACFLFLFFFDHYFYTIWPTQLLLWLFIGLVIKQVKDPVV